MSELWDCTECGWVGYDPIMSSKMLPEDTVHELCPMCLAEDVGPLDVDGLTVFPTWAGGAYVLRADDRRRAAAYMPANYSVDVVGRIVGHDVAGWTMAEYVLPRLASGGMFPMWVGSGPTD